MIPQALLDHVLANYKKPADLIGENGLLKQLTKAVVEAALNVDTVRQPGSPNSPMAGQERQGSESVLFS